MKTVDTAKRFLMRESVEDGLVWSGLVSPRQPWTGITGGVEDQKETA